jgi:hypothetical protein
MGWECRWITGKQCIGADWQLVGGTQRAGHDRVKVRRWKGAPVHCTLAKQWFETAARAGTEQAQLNLVKGLGPV